MISDAVTVPPGVLIRRTTALILSSCAARVSCSLIRASMLGEGMSPSFSWELIMPETSSSSTFAPPVPLTCVSRSGPGPGNNGKLNVHPAIDRPTSTIAITRLRMMSLHESDKFLEEIRGVMRPRGSLRMILNRKHRLIQTGHAFNRAIIQAKMCDRHSAVAGLHHRRLVRHVAVGLGNLHRKIVVLGCNFDFSISKIDHRMIRPMVAELELVGLEPEGESQDLMSQTNPEDRIPPNQFPHRFHGIGNPFRIAG